jgi:hypothetical protein
MADIRHRRMGDGRREPQFVACARQRFKSPPRPPILPSAWAHTLPHVLKLSQGPVPAAAKSARACKQACKH